MVLAVRPWTDHTGGLSTWPLKTVQTRSSLRPLPTLTSAIGVGNGTSAELQLWGAFPEAGGAPGHLMLRSGNQRGPDQKPSTGPESWASPWLEQRSWCKKAALLPALDGQGRGLPGSDTQDREKCKQVQGRPPSQRTLTGSLQLASG